MAISDAGFWNQAAAIEGRAGLTNAMANEKAKLQARVMLSGIARVASHEWDKRNLRVVPFARGTSSALSDPPDAIVLDIDASSDAEQADCFQLHDLLHVPMIVVTSDPSSARAVDLLARGVDDVVAHPAGPALLAASVSAVLRRNRRDSGGGIPKLLNLDSVQIDLVERQVRHGGVCHSLSRIEYRLLVALLRAEGRACSHRELIQQVWGPGYDSATHYLRLYIRYLREKVENNPRQPTRIVNVWGVGYRLVLTPSDRPVRVDAAADHAPHVTSVLAEDSWKRRSSSLQPAQRISS